MKIRIRRKITVNLHTIIFLLSIIVMLYSFLPITASVLTAAMMLGILAVLYSVIFLCSNWKRQKVIVSNILLSVSTVIIYIVREYYKDGVIGFYTVVLYFFPAFLAVFLFSKDDIQLLKKLAISILIMIVITGSTTFVALSLYPELARDLAAFSSDSIIGLSTMYNVGGYEFTYCVVLSIPIYCLLAEKKTSALMRKLIEILIFMISIIFIIKTQYTTALLLGIISCGMIIGIRKFALKRLCILAILGLLILGAFKGEIANELSNIATSIESESISQRLNELSKALEGGSITGEDMTERGNAYGKSIVAFSEHPILGTWSTSDHLEKLGGHSTVLDLLAGVGIFAFLLVMYAFYYVEKVMLSKNEGDITKKYVGIFLLIYTILACVNPIINGTFFAMLFIVLPGITLIENK